jgi:thymidine phosphorylase
MPSQFRKQPGESALKNVRLISIGSLEEKLFFCLSPLLLSSNIKIIFQSYAYPRELTLESIHDISHHLHQTQTRYVIFDLRIHNWRNPHQLERSRFLSQSLQDLCDQLRINHSIILSNGDLFLGNALGIIAEKKEAQKVLKGEGPLDLIKFVLEIGVDILLVTKKAHQRLDAKKSLRDKIISGELSSSRFDFPYKKSLTSLKKGYIHHFVLDKILALRYYLCSTHPETGLILIKKPGDWIAIGDAIVTMYGPKNQQSPVDQETCQKLLALSSKPPHHQPFFLERMGLKIYE